MKRTITATIGALLAFTALTGARAETIYLTAAHMVDPASGKVVASPAVIVKDDRIVSVGTAATLAAPRRTGAARPSRRC